MNRRGFLGMFLALLGLGGSLSTSCKALKPVVVIQYPPRLSAAELERLKLLARAFAEKHQMDLFYPVTNSDGSVYDLVYLGPA